MLQSLKNIYYLGIKEIRGLLKDWLMLVLIIYSFSYAIVVASKSQPDSLNNATIAIVDDDKSQLTKRLADAFQDRQHYLGDRQAVDDPFLRDSALGQCHRPAFQN